MTLPDASVIDPDRPANRPMAPAEHVGGGSGTYSGMLTAATGGSDESFFPHPNQDDVGTDMYRLEPDWTTQFKTGGELPPWIKERLAAKDSEVPLSPTQPWMDGTPTLWQRIPTAYATTPEKPAFINGVTQSQIADLEARMEARLAKMFAKLEDIDRGRNESNHMEIILFILGGFFLLLMLDMLVKQGMRATVMLAAAGGGNAAAIMMGGRW